MIELVAHNPPTQISGIGRYCRELFAHLKDNVDIRMAYPRFPPLSERFTFLRNFPMGVVGHRTNSLVHFTQIMGCAQMVWKPLHPAIATVHDLGVLICEDDQILFNKLDRHILELQLKGLKQVDLIVADSEFTRRTLIEYLGLSPQRVITVHLGIDFNRIRSILDSPNTILDRFPILREIPRPWLLYVGSELPRKNIRKLLEILAELRKLLPGVHLIKIGSPGGEKFRTQTYADIQSLGLERCVLFFNRIVEKDLYKFYQAADILVHPSKIEGFGFPVLEAFACGTPVVCSNVGSLPEVAGGAAIMHSSGETTSFVESVCRVCNDPLKRKEMAVRGKLQVEKFSWEMTAEKMKNVYRTVLDECGLNKR